MKKKNISIILAFVLLTFGIVITSSLAIEERDARQSAQTINTEQNANLHHSRPQENLTLTSREH